MSTQEQFPLSTPKSWKPSKAIDYPFGDGGQKPPDKRPRRQLRMWGLFGIPARKITVSLKGTLASSPLPVARSKGPKRGKGASPALPRPQIET